MLALVAVLGVLLSLVWLLFPKVLTGDYANITIEGISATPEGKVTLRIARVTSAGTPVFIQLFRNRKYAGGTRGESAPVFPRRTSRGVDTVSFDLNPEKAPVAGRFEDSPLFQRLRVQVGKTHHLHGDQVLTLFDFKTADGTRYSGFVRVNTSLSAI